VPPIITEADLELLPAPVQRYLRLTGSVGQPRILNFSIRWKGRMRSLATDRLLSLVTMVDAKGPVMDKSETVTILNDLCMFAPTALLDRALRWESSDRSFGARRFARHGEALTHAADGTFAYGEFALQSIDFNISAIARD
jgi:hypothetical protein